MSALLEVRGLRVEISMSTGLLCAVRNVSFTAYRGEVLCIVGESGCGKSLTSLAIVDLLPRGAYRYAEALRFAGRDLLTTTPSEMSDLRGNRICMIFQDPMTTLNPVLTIGDQLVEGYLRHKGGPRSVAVTRSMELLETAGISDPGNRLSQYPHQLSGGLRQRVMIAMSLMCEPELLIADEPTTALDVTIQIQVLSLLKRLQHEFGLAVVLITHDLGVVARMADRVLVMYAGEIVEQAMVAEIFASPRHPYTQGLLRCLPRKTGQRLGTIPGAVPSLIGTIDGCGFANRCPYTTEQCRKGRLPLEPVTTSHSYRCLLPEKVSLRHFRENTE